MKVTSYAVARPNYYDRNATGTSVRYLAGGIAPHAQTTRWTVTIAATFKGVAEIASGRIAGETAPTVAGAMIIGIDTYSGGVYSTVLFIQQTSAASLPVVYTAYPITLSLYASDQLLGFTSDASTGGTGNYRVDAKYTTYTA